MDSYNIQAASIISGVSVHQIRAWEKRYKAVMPKRLNNNFRSYSSEDIKRLKILGQLSRKGFPISQIAAADTAELENQLHSLDGELRNSRQGEEAFDPKEKLNLLLKFLMIKRYDLITHEVLKLKNLAALSGILIPLIRLMVINPTTWQEQDSKNLLNLLLDESQRISISARQ